MDHRPEVHISTRGLVRLGARAYRWVPGRCRTRLRRTVQKSKATHPASQQPTNQAKGQRDISG
eukprot:12760905-Heterocapsa_arctica.AAC.1